VTVDGAVAEAEAEASRERSPSHQQHPEHPQRPVGQRRLTTGSAMTRNRLADRSVTTTPPP
jgi:hypothetical protein